MEDKLENLLQAGDDKNRAQWALEHHQNDQKVIGVLCSYVPEEVIYAAGMLPWHVNGTFQAATPLGDSYFPVDVCAYVTHTFESLLQGNLDFLDGVIATDWDDDRRHLIDLWQHLKKGPFVELLFFPPTSSRPANKYLSKKIRQLMDDLGRYAEVTITDDNLWNAINIYNTTRSLLTRVNELRKREIPPLSGMEYHRLVSAATVMPKEVFNEKLEALLPYLEARKTSVESIAPRLLVSSDMLHDPSHLQLIEKTGALIVMDDLDRGSRFSGLNVDTSINDPASALAHRYLNRPACSRMDNWEEQFQQIINWVDEFQIQGVVELSLMYSRPRELRIPFFRRALQDSNIPLLNLRIDYTPSFVGQFETRIGAFIEMLD